VVITPSLAASVTGEFQEIGEEAADSLIVGGRHSITMLYARATLVWNCHRYQRTQRIIFDAA
jgi:hypothetical protein